MLDCLPRLSGAGLVAYRVAWASLLPVALISAVADQLASWSPVRALETLALLGTSIILFRRRAADAIAAMIALAFMLWIITASTAWAGLTGAAPLLAVFDRIRFLLFVTAMMLFPTGRFDPQWTRLGLGAILFSFGLGVAEAARLIPPGFHIPPTMACAALAVAAMRARLISLPPGVQRQQIKWVALGLALGLALVAVSRVGGLAQPQDPLVQAMLAGAFDLGVTLMALGVLVSLLRYRLYDADAAISRSSAVALMTVTLIGIFAAAEVVIQSLSQNLLGEGAGIASTAIAAALAATMIAPLHVWVGGWTERRFQPALAAFRKEMPELLDDLREGADMAVLGEAVLARIERATRTSRCLLFVGPEPVAARHMDMAGLETSSCPHEVPLEVEGAGRVGRLLLGPRPDGSRLGKDEREAIQKIARPLARAIRLVEKNAAAERRLKGQTKRISDLGRRLALLEKRAQAAAAVSTI